MVSRKHEAIMRMWLLSSIQLSTACHITGLGGKSKKSRGPRASGINHELQEVAIRISNVDAGGGLSTPSLPCDRTLEDLGSGPIEHGFERRRRAVPHKAQIAARWPSSWSAQGERLALPQGRTMKIDH